MRRLHEFLVKNKDEILELTESKTLELAGTRASSAQLKRGLPIFFKQLLGILLLDRRTTAATREANEPALALAKDVQEEAALAESAGQHGVEMLRLGYTLSHVVHAYGAMCQSITELAQMKGFLIDAAGFHALNQCLDVAIAGAVTEFEKFRDSIEQNRENQHIGALTHEMRNALTSASISFQMIKAGGVGVVSNTGKVLEKSLSRMQKLIDQSLTEVRLKIDPEPHVERNYLLVIVDQILVTAEIEAQSKKQKIEVKIDPELTIEVDQHAFHSTLSNLIQNAIKFTRVNGKIQIRARVEGEKLIVEVEDECGGLSEENAPDLFNAFEQHNKNRTGLGLGLTIAKQAMKLNRGTIDVRNLAGKGCVFKIELPKSIEEKLSVLKTGT